MDYTRPDKNPYDLHPFKMNSSGTIIRNKNNSMKICLMPLVPKDYYIT